MRKFDRSFQFVAGFSLIEILVAVAVSSIALTIIVTVGLQVIKAGRDAKRQGDLRQIQTVIEQYYTDHNYYPRVILLGHNSNVPLTDCSGAPTPCTATKFYSQPFPQDPTGTDSIHYCYEAYPDKSQSNVGGGSCNNETQLCKYYSLFAQLETSKDPAIGCNDTSGNHSANYRIGPD